MRDDIYGYPVFNARIEARRDAYHQVTERLGQVRDAKPVPDDIDVQRVVSIVFETLVRTYQLLPTIESVIPEAMPEIEPLESHAYALLYVHLEWEKKRQQYEALSSDAQEAAKDQALDLAWDFYSLTALLQNKWSDTPRSRPPSFANFERAQALAKELLFDAGHKHKDALELLVLESERRRAFALLVKTYEDLRDAVRFVNRPEVERLAPMLFADYEPVMFDATTAARPPADPLDFSSFAHRDTAPSPPAPEHTTAPHLARVIPIALGKRPGRPPGKSSPRGPHRR